jgi:hypothetical protein
MLEIRDGKTGLRIILPAGKKAALVCILLNGSCYTDGMFVAKIIKEHSDNIYF